MAQPHGGTAPHPATAPRVSSIQASNKRAEKKEQRTKEKAKDYLEKGGKLDRKGVVEKWENDKKLLDVFAEKDSDGLPPTATAPKKPAPVVDLADVVKKNRQLGETLIAALGTGDIRPTPEHENKEGNLPVYTTGKINYMELTYLGGGGRLVVDRRCGRQYVSMHYGIFYRVKINGSNPTQPQVVTDWLSDFFQYL